ncbi:MAG: TonB-dependent receptor [Acidobacteriia bacterium]|nr:TonB-dependent receptor [Terriglobia bacterium]
MTMKTLWRVLVLLVVAVAGAHAQSAGSPGEIRGTITDASGSGMPGVSVVVLDKQTGNDYRAVSNGQGQYRVAGLPPASYRVTAKGAGSGGKVQQDVKVTAGTSAVVDLRMQDKTGAPKSAFVKPEWEPGSQPGTLDSQQITDLPSVQRDVVRFSLLLPAVSDSNTTVDNLDFRVKQAPQSGLSILGSNGRGNSVSVDGGEADNDTGGFRTTVSQEAVKELQVVGSNFPTAQGPVAGRSVNIVTQSGSNELHGGVFGFFGNDAMNAADPFSMTQALQPSQVFNPASPDLQGVPVKNGLSQQQFGGSVGMPLSKDKTYVFGSFEGLRRDAQDAVSLLRNTSLFRPESDAQNDQAAVINGLATLAGNPPVPCLTGQPALPAATCAAILTNILTINPVTSPLNAYLVNQFENNGGTFPYLTRDYLASLRMDNDFSKNDRFTVRFNFGHNQDEAPDSQIFNGFSRGSAIHSYDYAGQASWSHDFSPMTRNELRFQLAYSHFDVLPNQTGAAGLDIAGYANLGTDYYLPSRTGMTHAQFADNVAMTRGRHKLDLGIEEWIRRDNTDSSAFMPGRFVFGALPGGILSPCLQVPAACGLVGVNAATINALQSASLGLPQFYQQGFGLGAYSYTSPLTTVYAQDAFSLRPNFTLTLGVRYGLEANFGTLNTDENNVAPRVAFAWDPFNDHKTVVRGGYAIAYVPYNSQIADLVGLLGTVNYYRQIANIDIPLTGVPGNPALTSAAVFQTLFAQGKVQCTVPAPGDPACITPADLTQFGISITHSGALMPLTTLFSASANFRNAYSQQGEFGIEHELAGGLTVSASYVYVHTVGLPVALDSNLLTPPVTSVTLANGQPFSYHNWGALGCPASCFVDPTILQNNVYSSVASAVYQGGIFEARFDNELRTTPTARPSTMPPTTIPNMPRSTS